MRRKLKVQTVFEVVYVLRRWILLLSALRFANAPNQLRVELASAHRFHHGEMLKVVMGLEERVSSVELDQYTSNAPDITRIAPPQIEYNFRSSIVSSGYDGRMIFIVEGSRTEVYQSDLRVQQHLPVPC